MSSTQPHHDHPSQPPETSNGTTTTTSPFTKPQPRPPRTPAESAAIRIRNRRREYLERNPSYFSSVEHELADPLLYDTLIRRFQTPQEREQEGRAKGYSRVLEGSLLRGEARLARMAESYTDTDDADADDDTQPTPEAHQAPAAASSSSTQQPSRQTFLAPDNAATTTASTAATAEVDQSPPGDRAEGRQRWEAFLRDRFVHGGDDEFDYAGTVDADDQYDGLERRDEEERWFDDEEERWASSGDDGGDRKEDGEGKGRAVRGETGVQDF